MASGNLKPNLLAISKKPLALFSTSKVKNGNDYYIDILSSVKIFYNLAVKITFFADLEDNHQQIQDKNLIFYILLQQQKKLPVKLFC
jgi:hypothetical protein